MAKIRSFDIPLFSKNKAILAREEDFASFYYESYPSLFYFILKIVKYQAITEDIIQDSFMVIWGKRFQFENLKVARAFLYTTARNASLNWLRSNKVAQKNQSGIVNLFYTNQHPIIEDIIRAELTHLLHIFCDELPPQCKKILYKLYQEGKNYHEVSEEMHLSVNTIKAQRARGLALLKKKMI